MDDEDKWCVFYNCVDKDYHFAKAEIIEYLQHMHPLAIVKYGTCSECKKFVESKGSKK